MWSRYYLTPCARSAFHVIASSLVATIVSCYGTFGTMSMASCIHCHRDLVSLPARQDEALIA